jgi:hypothetical protein
MRSIKFADIGQKPDLRVEPVVATRRPPVQLQAKVVPVETPHPPASSKGRAPQQP